MEEINEWSKLLQCAVAALWLLGFWVIGGIYSRWLGRWLSQLAQKTRTPYPDLAVRAFHKPIVCFFLLCGICVALLFLPVSALKTTLFYSQLRKAFRIGVIVLVSWGFLKGGGMVPLMIQQARGYLDLDSGKALTRFLGRVFQVIVVAFATVLIINELGYNVNGLVAGLGLGGLTFALAAQDAAGNFFGGFIIITERPFEIGDWISTSSLEGTVEDITLRSTKIRTLANALTIVPNAKLCAEPITNWTRMKMRMAQFTLGVTYATPKQKLEAVVADLRNVLQTHPDVRAETVQVHLDSFAQSSININVLFYTKSTAIAEFRDIKEDVNLKIMDILSRHNVAFAFPSQSIYLEASDTLRSFK